MIDVWKEFYCTFLKSLEQKETIDADDAEYFCPNSFQEIFIRYSEDLGKIVQNIADGNLKKEIVPSKDDKRFLDPEWQENPIFNLIKQNYLLNCKYTWEILGQGKKKNKKDPFIKNILNALAPTNFPLSNPSVIRETLEKQGENIQKGINIFFEKCLSDGTFLPEQTDVKAFKVGKNIAKTKGAVVFENEILQLIEYYPTQKENVQNPLLIVPPWINKYYIFDLAEDKSFVRWNLDQGRKIYLISWVNADPSYHDVGLEAFLKKGVLKAIQVIHAKNPHVKLNTLGFCVGGIALAAALALLKDKQEKYCTSATFLATPFDFSKLSDLATLVSKDSIESTIKLMEKHGILPGSHLMQAFSFLRDNDLIWNNFINTYLMGKRPKANDFLYWNSDCTNLPKKMHSEYLKIISTNSLLKKTGMCVSNEKISFHQLCVPTFIVATKRDHIVPWKAAFEGCRVLQQTTFVLGDSGHVAGIMNHPSKKKYNHWVNKQAMDNAGGWIKTAEEKEGSWWLTWSDWLQKFDGPLTKAKSPRKKEIIEPAPGRYAMDPSPVIHLRE